MGEIPRTLIDAPLPPDGAIPYRLASAFRARWVAAARPALAALTLGLATTGVFVATTTTVTPGVLADSQAGIVLSADRDGFAWRDGIRPGQSIVALTAADEPGGWRIETIDENGISRVSASEPVQSSLGRTVTLGLLAMALGCIGMMLRGRRAPIGPAATIAGAGLAILPMFVVAEPTVSGLSAALAVTIAMTALAAELPTLRARLVWLVASALVGSAFVLSASTTGRFEYAWTLCVSAILGVVWLSHREIRVMTRGWARRDTLDGITLSGIGAVAIVASITGIAPWPLALAVGTLSAIAYGATRVRFSRVVNRTWLDGVRSSAMIVAVDRERSKLAADIHDAPLQELAGVIARLESYPHLAAERALLRSTSQHLRQVVTGLEPPMLGHLGIADALAYLASQQSLAGPVVHMALAAEGGRPPPSVEVAAFRVAEEAIRNAGRHGLASRIEITGEVRADRVRVVVHDDGTGLTETSSSGSGTAGMVARAHAVDGTMIRTSGSDGTSVGFLWPSL